MIDKQRKRWLKHEITKQNALLRLMISINRLIRKSNLSLFSFESKPKILFSRQQKQLLNITGCHSCLKFAMVFNTLCFPLIFQFFFTSKVTVHNVRSLCKLTCGLIRMCQTHLICIINLVRVRWGKKTEPSYHMAERMML